MKSNKIYYITAFIFVLTVISCKKFVQISPPETQIINTTVFSSDGTATAALVGIYSQMMNNSYPDFANGGITLYSGLSSDEFINYTLSGSQPEFYNNSLTPTNIYVKQLWGSAYSFIYAANAVLEGLGKSTEVSESIKNKLQGEAKFIRAFCHFYLVNLFGDIPYVVTSDFNENSTITRLPMSQVYQMIIADLMEAKNLLANDYSFSNNERTRPNKWAATALLARVYLYTKDWTNAEIHATEVINNVALYDTVSLNNVYKANSKEAIWQLMPGQNTGINTREGNRFILTSQPTLISLSASLVNSFESGDMRKNSWVGSITVGTTTYFYAYKYKVKSGTTLSEYYMVLRLAEQYLIRAEARANGVGAGLSGAIADVSKIRTRAGLSIYTGPNDRDSVLKAIYHERQVELFSEWGHRWFDLKRWGLADSILAIIKSSNWQPTDKLYPLPIVQLQNDPNMSQNPGY